MPSISNLDLTMSRDTNGVITARVDFDLQFSQAEIDANVVVTERVALVRRVGHVDLWNLSVAGGVAQSPAGGGDLADTTIAVLSQSDVRPASFGPLDAAGTVARSFTHVLIPGERDALLEPGTDHPYALVSAVPRGVSADLKLAAVEMLDVGDPEMIRTVDVGDEPTALVADGRGRFYVATTGGDVVVFDRSGDPLGRFTVGGTLSGLAYDGTMFWAAVLDGNVLKPFDQDGTVGTPRPTGGSEPVAVVALGSSVWVANAGSQTVTQITADGVASTTPVAGKPVALALSPHGYVAVAVANADDGSHVQSIDGTGAVGTTWPIPGLPPRRLAMWTDGLIEMPVYTCEDGAHIVSLVSVALDGGPSRGVAVGAGAFWVTLESNELAKYVGLVPGLASSFPVGAGADVVVFDGDRLYVSNRDDRSVTIVRI